MFNAALFAAWLKSFAVQEAPNSVHVGMEDWSGRGDLVDGPHYAADDYPCLPSSASFIDTNSDSYLMGATGRGDVRAYSRLVERHLPSVYRLCYRLSGDRHEAEDLSQESFARLWQSAPNWRSTGGGVPAWLHRVARNLCIDRRRAPLEITTSSWPDIEDDAPDAARRIEARQLQGLLEACLLRLSPAHRSALVLSYYEGYSNALAAQIMDMKLKAFESLLLRARRRMWAELSAVGVHGDDLVVLS